MGDKLNKRQHGFQKGRGRHTALAIITEQIATSVKNRNQTNLILRDISKAFDKVWHKGLKYKILQQQLPRPYEQIFCNYITNREACIHYDSQ